MEFLLGDDDDEYACVEDFLLDHALPEEGCLLNIHLGGRAGTNLNSKIVIADSACWHVPVLNVGQESYAHAGFRGTIDKLLEKVIRDIEMMRSGYSAQVQPKFDKFIEQVNCLLNTSSIFIEENDISDIHLVIRDPSGLSTTELISNSNNNQNQNVSISYFPRSLNEEKELGILEENSGSISSYIKVVNQLTTAVEIAELIRKSSYVVALTGAGISVESGITPFRTATNNVPNSNKDQDKNDKDGGGGGGGGEEEYMKDKLVTSESAEEEVVNHDDQILLEDSIWSSFDVSRMTISRFNNHLNENDAIYWWRMKHAILPEILNAKPNHAHNIFGLLFTQNKLGCVITQNIDSLHSHAGVPLDKVIEIHGHMRGLICSDHSTIYNPIPYSYGTCDFKLNHQEAIEKDFYYQHETLPKCPTCNSPLRTETVLFEQPMPYGVMEQASTHVAKADLLIIIGSTLVVKPASDLPLEALRRNTPIVIINPYDTSQYDEYATGLIRQPASVFMEQ